MIFKITKDTIQILINENYNVFKVHYSILYLLVSFMACLTEAIKETAKNICRCMYYSQIHGSLRMFDIPDS